MVTVAIAYISLCIIWGTTYLAIKITLEGFDPFFMGGVRFLVAGLCLTPILYWRWSAIPRDRRTLGWIILAGLLMLAGANGLVNLAEVSLDSGLTALTVCTSPAWSALIGGFVFSRHERFDRWSLAGVTLAIGGVYVLHHERLDFRHAELTGVVSALVAPVLWSIGSLLIRRHAKGIDVLVTTSIQSLSACLAFFLISLLLSESWSPDLTPRVVGSLAFLIFAGTLITYAAFAYLLKHMAASRATTYAFVNPIIALIAGNIILSEPIVPEILPASLMILGGLALVYYGHNRGRSNSAKSEAK